MLEGFTKADTRVDDEFIGSQPRTLCAFHTLPETLSDVCANVVVGYLALLHCFGRAPHMHHDGGALSFSDDSRHLGVAKT